MQKLCDIEQQEIRFSGISICGMLKLREKNIPIQSDKATSVQNIFLLKNFKFLLCETHSLFL